jgi:hypothetical protein
MYEVSRQTHDTLDDTVSVKECSITNIVRLTLGSSSVLANGETLLKYC